MLANQFHRLWRSFKRIPGTLPEGVTRRVHQKQILLGLVEHLYLQKKLFTRLSQSSCYYSKKSGVVFKGHKNNEKINSLLQLNCAESRDPLCSKILVHKRAITSESMDSRTGDIQGTNSPPEHIPVMVEEILELLQPQDGQIVVDMTFGAGGHCKEILSVAPRVRYIASDRDPYAYNIAERTASQHSHVTPVLAKFSEVGQALLSLDIQPGTVDAFLFDLGASSMQFDTAQRGFSLSRDGPLDMRMDGDRNPESITAADVVNTLEPHDLAHILKKYGEECRAKEVAHAIVEARYAFGNFSRTQQLADVVQAVFNNSHGTSFRHDKLYRHAHVATKTFQALRIFVNNELNELHNGIETAHHFLRPGGRCTVISFHSLEDRIAKRHFHGIDLDEKSNMTIHQHYRNANMTFDIDSIKEECLSKSWQPLSRKVLEASDSETYRNPRSRSAKLRVAVKL